MPRFSDVLTGKHSASFPVSYEKAIEQFSFNFFKACMLGDFKYISDLCYGIGFMYHKRRGKVQDDLIKRADKHAEEICRRIGIPLPDMNDFTIAIARRITA